MPTPPIRVSGACSWPLALGIALAGALVLAGAERAAAFGLDDVAKRAKKLAGQSYHEPDRNQPGWLREITYDQWRDIRFRPDRALWLDKNLPFTVQFFHPGFYYDRSVHVNEVTAKGGPNAIREAKQLIRTVAQLPEDEAFRFAEKKIAAIFASAEAAEGMAAFAQKRPPRWAEPG